MKHIEFRVQVVGSKEAYSFRNRAAAEAKMRELQAQGKTVKMGPVKVL